MSAESQESHAAERLGLDRGRCAGGRHGGPEALIKGGHDTPETHSHTRSLIQAEFISARVWNTSPGPRSRRCLLGVHSFSMETDREGGKQEVTKCQHARESSGIKEEASS